MALFEIRFSVPTSNEPGKATYYANVLTRNMVTVVEAFTLGQAQAQVKAQYGPNTIVHGGRPL